MRTAKINRRTNETDIQIALNLDGTGKRDINTGIPFFDHMLEQVSCHGAIDLEIKSEGDLNVDMHHTIEDIGIVLGKAILEVIGSKSGLCRYGYSYIPLDEALSRVVIDLSGRPNLQYNVFFTRSRINNFDVDLVREFFQGFVNHSLTTLHIDNLRGLNAHHQCETIFKAFGNALKMATRYNSTILNNSVLSTKGLL